MSRHRHVRNRAYSYEEEVYDDDYDDYYDDAPPPASPPSNPSVARPPAVSLASFVPHPPSPPKKKLNTEPKPSERGAAQVAQWTRAETQTQTRAHALASTGPTPLSLVVIGHVDAGKSTVVGHLLYQMGTVPPKTVHKYTKEAQTAGKASAAFAWVVDAADAERTRGVTMDVGVQSFTTRTKHVTLLDAPGHRDFIPQMLTGATQADVALLVVPAALGEFEAAVDDGGQTKEHTLLVRSLGVTHVVVAVNKMDTVGWTHERFRTIQEQLATWLDHAGFRRNKVQFVPVSGLTGVNLKQTGGDDRVAWYTGPSLVEAIDALTPPQRQIAKPFRMTVADVSKSKRLGHTISGRIYAGAAAVGDSFLLMPVGLSVTVKGMEQDGRACPLARAGETIEMGVTGIDPAALTTGSILCSLASPVRVATKMEAKIMTMPTVDVPLVKGSCVTLHVHTVNEPATVSRLVSLLTKTGDVEKTRPRCITRERAAVVHITCPRRICVEEFAAYRQLGRVTLRDRGKTVAAGIITKLLE